MSYPRALVSVMVTGRTDSEPTDDPERWPGENITTGRDVLVMANGHILPCHSVTLRVAGRKAIATLEVEVDEVRLVNISTELRTRLSNEKLARCRELLETLDRRGRLGLDVHQEIRNMLEETK